MKGYTDKLTELGIEALEENKKEIKDAIKESQIEIIKKTPQYLEKILDYLPDIFAGENHGED